MGSQRLTAGRVLPTLLRFSFPFLIANILQALYGAVDLAVAGRFADSAAVCAVATGSQVMQTITGLCVGLATGGTVMIGQFFGAGNRYEVKNSITAALALFGILSVGLTVLAAAAVPQICTAMQVPGEALPATRQYLFICSCGILFITGYNAASAILRGLGDSRSPLLFVAAACATNIAGDLLLVGGLGLGAAGAAIATVASQALSLLLSALYLSTKGLISKFLKSKLRIHVYSVQRILAVGLPIALQDGLVNFSFLLITAIVNAMGLTAAAAVGVVEKLIIFSMLPTTAVASAVAAMVAQQKGAGLMRRAHACLHTGVALSLALGIPFFITAQCNGSFLLRLFTTDAPVVQAGVEYLSSYSMDCLLVCFVFCMNSYFCGCGYSGFPLLHSVLATFLVRVPLSYYISRLPGASMFLMGCAAPLASFLSLLLCLGYLKRLKRRNLSFHALAFAEKASA